MPTHTGALGTRPLLYPHVGPPVMCHAPYPIGGAVTTPAAEPGRGVWGEPESIAGSGVALAFPACLRRHRESDVASPRPARGRERPADARTASSLSSDLSAAAPARWVLILAQPVRFGGQDEAEAARAQR